MIQLPSSKLQQAGSHNEDRGNKLRDPPPEGRATDEYTHSHISLQLIPIQGKRDESRRDDCVLLSLHSLLSHRGLRVASVYVHH